MEKLRAVLTARSPALSAKLSTGNTMTVGMGSAVGKGTVYTPHITDDGILSWTNDGNRDNPAPTNIKGPKGDPGTLGDVADQAVMTGEGGTLIAVAPANARTKLDVYSKDEVQTYVTSQINAIANYEEASF